MRTTYYLEGGWTSSGGDRTIRLRADEKTDAERVAAPDTSGNGVKQRRSAITGTPFHRAAGFQQESYHLRPVGWMCRRRRIQ